MVDDSGAEVGHVIYDAYGQIVENTVPLTLTDRLYTGQVFDASTGLYYYNARYYDPYLGQFTQPDSLVADPLDPRAWNRFGYVYGNPVNYTDPSGHCPGCGVSSKGEPLFQGPIDWVNRITQLTAWPIFAASQGITEQYYLGSSVRITGGLSPEISYAERWLMSSRSRYLLGSGTTEVYPRAVRRSVRTPFAGRATKLSNALLAANATINAYNTLDRYFRLGEITRHQAGYELLVNAGFTGLTYYIGLGAAKIVSSYTVLGGPVSPIVSLVGVGLSFLTFDLMVLQGAVNNWIEGQSTWEGILNARNSTLDSLGGLIGKDHRDWDGYLRSWGIY